MLIDARETRGSSPGREPIDIDWRLIFWIVACLVLYAGAASVPPLPGVVLAFGGVLATFQLLIVATGGYGTGLRDWRQ